MSAKLYSLKCRLRSTISRSLSCICEDACLVRLRERCHARQLRWRRSSEECRSLS